MNRIILLALALILGSLGARLLYTSLVADETKIRWMVEDMVEGFNAGKARRSVAGFDNDWQHEGRSVDREMLRAGVLGEAMQGGLGSKREFPRKIEVLPDSLIIRVAEGSQSASLGIELRLFRRRAEGDDVSAWEQEWHYRIEAELHLTEDGWRILTSRHEEF